MAGRLQNAYRWRFLNKSMRFMQVLRTFLMPSGAWDFRRVKNMRKTAGKCNILIKSSQRLAFFGLLLGGGFGGGSAGRLTGWLAGWPAGGLGGWLAGKLENAHRWRISNKKKRFMQVLKTF